MKVESLAKGGALSECSVTISDGHYPTISASTVSGHSHGIPASPYHRYEETRGSNRTGGSSKGSHQESGQGPHWGSQTPVPVIFTLNFEVTEGKGFGASLVALGRSRGWWARACQRSGQGDRTPLKACLELTGVLQLSVHAGRGVAAVRVLVVGIHSGLGWAEAICGVGRKSWALEKCRQSAG